MSLITSFPSRFNLINERVAELHLIHALSRDDLEPETLALFHELDVVEDYRACDFYIVLKDGRCFGFEARTPEYLRDALDRNHAISFAWPGLVVVGTVTLEAILDNLEQCFASEDHYGLEHFGYRCDKDHETLLIST